VIASLLSDREPSVVNWLREQWFNNNKLSLLYSQPDRDEGFLEVKEAEAKEQHKSIIGALKASALKWEFEHIIFAVGNHRSVVESDFYSKLKKLDVQEGKKTSSSLIM